jgi:hypothetical protein
MCILKCLSAVKPERVKLPVLKKKSAETRVSALQGMTFITLKCLILLQKKFYD